MPPILIGLISDTHGLVRPSIHRAFEGVSQILHAGDVGGDDVLIALATIAPVRAVIGNVDDPSDPRLEERIFLEVGGMSIHVSHGHEFGSPTPVKLLQRYDARVLIFGHTHKALVHREGSRLVVNPGAAGRRRFNIVPSAARLSVEHGRATVEIVELTD